MAPAQETTGGSLVERIRAGDPRGIARAISLVEDADPAAAAVLAAIHAHTGRAFIVGVTGPPGAGKSTLVDGLVTAYRRAGARVAVLAVDPSSPFSGGSVLGDRVRLQVHATDAGVFIRSMATRGHLGGLAGATAAAAAVLDAAGYDPILVETAGVGQSEVEVVELADVVVVLAVPGAGDDVQALKAGVMEIADLFVVNKADRDGADGVVATIETMLSLDAQADADTRPAVLRTVATTGQGIAELIEGLARLRGERAERNQTRRRLRESRQVRHLVAETLLARIAPAAFAEATDRVANRDIDPVEAARQLAGASCDLDHVGIAVARLDESAAFFGGVLGLHVDAPEDLPGQGVRVQFLGAGDARIELIAPIAESSPVAAFLRTKGPGLHHVALRVEDLDGTLADLRARSVKLVDTRARPGAHGTRVAFVHPSASRGVLVELVERKDRT